MSDKLSTLLNLMNGGGSRAEIAAAINTDSFFKPDDEFINWIVNYANGRRIIEVGCGNGETLGRLVDAGGFGYGIEPFWNFENHVKRMAEGKEALQVVPMAVQKMPELLEKADNALILICRPCHSGFHNFCKVIAHPNAEVLYIGLRRNFGIDDIDESGRIPHQGDSVDGELVIQLKAPQNG